MAWPSVHETSRRPRPSAFSTCTLRAPLGTVSVLKNMKPWPFTTSPSLMSTAWIAPSPMSPERIAPSLTLAPVTASSARAVVPDRAGCQIGGRRRCRRRAWPSRPTPSASFGRRDREVLELRRRDRLGPELAGPDGTRPEIDELDGAVLDLGAGDRVALQVGGADGRRGVAGAAEGAAEGHERDEGCRSRPAQGDAHRVFLLGRAARPDGARCAGMTRPGEVPYGAIGAIATRGCAAQVRDAVAQVEADGPDDRPQVVQREALDVRAAEQVVAADGPDRRARRARRRGALERAGRDAQVAAQPADARRAHALRDRDVAAARPLELHPREVDARALGELERLREARVDLHQQGLAARACGGTRPRSSPRARCAARARAPTRSSARAGRSCGASWTSRRAAASSARGASRGAPARPRRRRTACASRARPWRTPAPATGLSVPHEVGRGVAGLLRRLDEHGREPLAAAVRGVAPGARRLDDGGQAQRRDRRQHLVGRGGGDRAGAGDAELGGHGERRRLAGRDVHGLRRRRPPGA